MENTTKISEKNKPFIEPSMELEFNKEQINKTKKLALIILTFGFWVTVPSTSTACITVIGVISKTFILSTPTLITLTVSSLFILIGIIILIVGICLLYSYYKKDYLINNHQKFNYDVNLLRERRKNSVEWKSLYHAIFFGKDFYEYFNTGKKINNYDFSKYNSLAIKILEIDPKKYKKLGLYISTNHLKSLLLEIKNSSKISKNLKAEIKLQILKNYLLTNFKEIDESKIFLHTKNPGNRVPIIYCIQSTAILINYFAIPIWNFFCTEKYCLEKKDSELKTLLNEFVITSLKSFSKCYFKRKVEKQEYKDFQYNLFLKEKCIDKISYLKNYNKELFVEDWETDISEEDFNELKTFLMENLDAPTYLLCPHSHYKKNYQMNIIQKFNDEINSLLKKREKSVNWIGLKNLIGNLLDLKEHSRSKFFKSLNTGKKINNYDFSKYNSLAIKILEIDPNEYKKLGCYISIEHLKSLTTEIKNSSKIPENLKAEINLQILKNYLSTNFKEIKSKILNSFLHPDRYPVAHCFCNLTLLITYFAIPIWNFFRIEKSSNSEDKFIQDSTNKLKEKEDQEIKNLLNNFVITPFNFYFKKYFKRYADNSRYIRFTGKTYDASQYNLFFSDLIEKFNTHEFKKEEISEEDFNKLTTFLMEILKKLPNTPLEEISL
jgi:hypothetical protein